MNAPFQYCLVSFNWIVTSPSERSTSINCKMATAVGALDDAIKEYLVYRGFTNTLKQFESEKKDDKDKNFRVCKPQSLLILILYCDFYT